MKYKFALIFALISCLGLCSEVDLRLIYPEKMILPDQVNLGEVAPGQELKLIFERSSGAYLWDTFDVHSDVNTSIQTNATHFTILAKGIGPGNHYIDLKVSNSLNLQIQKSSRIIFSGNYDVFKFTVSKQYTAQAGERSCFQMGVESKSIAEENFEVYFDGVPSRWQEFSILKVPPKSKGNFSVCMTPTEENFYNVKVIFRGNVEYKQQTGIRIYPSLVSKFKSCAEGFSIIPILQPFFSLFSLLKV
ncbi:MAG: hypothetical protein QW735_01620 [archaeon]